MKMLATMLFSALIFAGTAAAQNAKPLTQDEAVSFIKGKDRDGVNPRWTASFNFKDDGTVSGAGSAGSDSGTYTVEGGKLCLKWTKRWKNVCGQLVKGPDGTVSQVTDDGSAWIAFKN